MNILIATRSTSVAPDCAAIRHRQQATWAARDYAVVGPTRQIVGERLGEATAPASACSMSPPGTGNRNATLAAARRFAQVTSTDYVGPLLDRDREALR
jgi:hypothetical protein